jgi:hypothetical protein
MSETFVPTTLFTSTLTLCGRAIPCAVLERPDMEPLRLLDAALALDFFDEPVTSFLELARLPHMQPFFRRTVTASVTPVPYRDREGREHVGIDADLFADVVRAYWRAHLAHALPPESVATGEQCEDLVQGFATYAAPWVLVDEATGYQAVRAPDALRRRLAGMCEAQPELGEALAMLTSLVDGRALKDSTP